MCVLACVALSACGRQDASAAGNPDQAAPFPVVAPTVKDAMIAREYVADIRALRQADVRSRFRGILESVSVDEGQAVTAGQILFTINTRVRKQDLLVAHAATLGATAELEAVELELQNTRVLADKNVVSAAELARATSKVHVARAELERTKAAEARAAVELDRAHVRAPFAGVINRIPHRAGSAVGEDDLLTTITDASEVYAYFAISERDYLRYGQAEPAARPRTVSLVLANGATFPEAGTVDAIGSEIDAATGTLTYRARFANPARLLRHGSSGKVVIKTELRDALLVPQRSTFEVQGDYYLYVIDAGGVARARKVHVRARLDDMFAVDGGLARDDRFVLEGVQKLRDGEKIEVRGAKG